MKGKILFLTTHNLATNPRLVKEMRLALENKYHITVVYFRFDNWSKKINDLLLAEFETVEFVQVSAERKPNFNWVKSLLGERFFQCMGSFISLPEYYMSWAVSRRSYMLIKSLIKISAADWVIGHNPGAMYPAMIASRRFKCKCGFDVEDYHPGEGNRKIHQSLILILMKKILPQFDYVSYASSSIKSQCERAISTLERGTHIVIPNSFPSDNFTYKECHSEKLQLVWFSQNIAYGRGLECIMPIILKSPNLFQLTLFGKVEESFYNQYNSNLAITWRFTVEPAKLNDELSSFDIGLAIEPGKDINNTLALSNKIISYSQAGLYIVATDTEEQLRFINEDRDRGTIIRKDFFDAEIVLLQLFQRKENIRIKKKLRFENAKNLSWENFSSELRSTWSKYRN